MELVKNIAALAGCFTAVVAVLVVLAGLWKKVEAVCEGQKSLLRSDMLHTYYKHHETKQIRQYEYEAFLRSYAAYKALGGNSFIDRIYEEIKTWEVLT